MGRGLADAVSVDDLSTKNLASMMHVIHGMTQRTEPFMRDVLDDYREPFDRQDREMQARLGLATAAGTAELGELVGLLDGPEGLATELTTHPSGPRYQMLLTNLQAEYQRRDQAATKIQRAFKAHQQVQREQTLISSGVQAAAARQQNHAELTDIEKQLVGFLVELHKEAESAIKGLVKKGDLGRAKKVATRAEKDVQAYLDKLEARIKERVDEKQALAVCPTAAGVVLTRQLNLFKTSRAIPLDAVTFLHAIDEFNAHRLMGADAVPCQAYRDYWLTVLPTWQGLTPNDKQKAYAKFWCPQTIRAEKLAKVSLDRLEKILKQTNPTAQVILDDTEPIWEYLYRFEVKEIMGIILRCQTPDVQLAPTTVFQFMADRWKENEFQAFIKKNCEFAVWAVKRQNNWSWDFLKRFKLQTIGGGNAAKKFPAEFNSRFKTYDLLHIAIRHLCTHFDPGEYKKAPLADATGFFPEGTTLDGVRVLLQQVIQAFNPGQQTGGRKYVTVEGERYCIGFQGDHINQFFRCTQGAGLYDRDQLLELCSVLEPPVPMLVNMK